ncbi:hypothetical protein SAMN05444162_2902 [Paenibacillaceae bacterium GAS479]|nr:hypothetical protein SAMN05444162_2902 [Paenibacillaceae bacterium GAS479]
MSLPVRERGLKRVRRGEHFEQETSLPVRERGLKPLIPSRSPGDTRVAPRAGAWIETIASPSFFYDIASLPVRERGLKLPDLDGSRRIWGRSPCGSVD